MSRAAAWPFAFALLASLALAAEKAPAPPAGWKEYTTADGAFTAWIPASAKRQVDRTRTESSGGLPFTIAQLYIELDSGLIYNVERVIPTAGIRLVPPQGDLDSAIKELLLGEFRGKLAKESTVKLGTLAGKEYEITTGRGLARARVFFIGNRVVILHAEGTAEQVQNKDTLVFLDSMRLGAGKPAAEQAETQVIVKTETKTTVTETPVNTTPAPAVASTSKPTVEPKRPVKESPKSKTPPTSTGSTSSTAYNVTLPIPEHSLACDLSLWQGAFSITKMSYDKDTNQIVFLVTALRDFNFKDDGFGSIKFYDADNVDLIKNKNLKFDPEPKALKTGDATRARLDLPNEGLLKQTKRTAAVASGFFMK